MDDGLGPACVARHLLAKAWLLLAKALAANRLPPWWRSPGAWDASWRRGRLRKCFPDAVEEKEARDVAQSLVDEYSAAPSGLEEPEVRHTILTARRKAVSLLKLVVEADGSNSEARLLVSLVPRLARQAPASLLGRADAALLCCLRRPHSQACCSSSRPN